MIAEHEHGAGPAPASNAVTTGPLARYLLPSIRDLIFLIAFWALLAGPLSNRPLADADIGWHIRAGEQILSTHAVPRVDPFSSTMQGQPWFAWEWLYDALLGLAHRAMGLNGVVLFAALIMASTLALLFRQLVERGTGVPLAVLLWLLALGGASIHMFARPHIASWLLTLLWFMALERWEKGIAPRWLPWFFPLSAVLWVNLHGGWIFAFALFALFIAAALIESLRAANTFEQVLLRQRTRAMIGTFAVSGLATLVNPYGVRLHLHIYRYLGDSFLMNRIAEFRSPEFHGMGQRCYVLILVLTLLAFAARGSKLRVSRWLVVPAVAFSGVYAARNLPVASMLLVLMAGPMLWMEIVSLAERPTVWRPLRGLTASIVRIGVKADSQERVLRGVLWPALGTTLAIAICLGGGRIGGRGLVHAQFDHRNLPVGAVEYLRQEDTREPVFGPDQWGGFLIYRLYPQRQVVIDDRHDLYGSDRFREYDILMGGSPGWKDVLDRWRIRTIIVQNDSTLANLLRMKPQEWEVMYQDPVAVVIEKKNEP